MRVRFNRNQPNAQQKKVLVQECERIFAKHLDAYNREATLQILHILHFDFGFGEKRLRKFFEKLSQMQEKYTERYEVKEEDVPDICEIQLRDAGINIEDFLKEGDKNAE